MVDGAERLDGVAADRSEARGMTPPTLAAEYQAGKSIRDLAWKYDLGRLTILKALRAAGVAPRASGGKAAWQRLNEKGVAEANDRKRQR